MLQQVPICHSFLRVNNILLFIAAATAHERGREELPHVRGQGQKPGGPRARGAAAKRSYPASEVRGCRRKCQAATAHERPAPCPRPRAAAGRNYPHPRPEAAAARSCPRAKEPWLRGAGGPRGATPCSRLGGAAVRRYPTTKVRETQLRQ